MQTFSIRLSSGDIVHFGVKGQKWGVRRTPEQLGHTKSYDRKMDLNQETLNQYKNQYKNLQHIRISKNTKGALYTKNGKVVGMINTEKKDGVTWLQGLEVFGDNKGKGLGTKLLDTAVKEYGVTNLSVRKTNTAAKNLYDKYGFKTYGEDDYMYYMNIKR